MSDEKQQQDITKKKVVFHLPDMDDVSIRCDAVYESSDSGLLTFDIYYPLSAKSQTLTPAVVFVLGYSDIGFQRMLGSKQKDMQSYISWAQLVAASGLAAITYTTNEPITNTSSLIQYVRQNSASLGIDSNRIALWACSGNVPNALWVLMQENSNHLRCAVLCYGIMLDLEGARSAAEAAKRWGFVNPCTGKTVNDLPQTVPLFIVRSGKDETPHLNKMIDQFIASALKCNLAITIANHATGPHSFDVMDDSEESRALIRRILDFMKYHLLETEAVQLPTNKGMQRTRN